ncbi:ATP-dependent DNA helicase UvrD2 [Actinobaculum sp. 352]|uniref:ATP-dependent DNA helicase UvrD2 n=1 Tax=Actinobaculum sp. 352 TaxID=2490946 RepID=UPI000F7DEC2F|nr:ATP-dependent DNA helicase UvrD2 [Actinobaculum sp. 352]RTE49052.1 ATP-dependent DNA helicase UvrD2 [Actinobaculum sp. 352]
METPQELLEHLDPEQREVATHLRGPLCVRAGAGTGKTRAITYRIAYGVHAGAFEPNHVLAVTFTARAAGEMRSRLRDLGVSGVVARTFHAAALSQLNYFWSTAIGGRMPPVTEHKGALVAQAAARLGMSYDRVAVRDLTAEIEWAKVSLITPEAYAERAAAAGHIDVAGHSAAEIVQLLRVYEEVKEDAHQIDFEDTLLYLVGILLDRPDIARQIRGQYRHFTVDEYQDVSPLQHRLLQLWLGESRELCVVGDVSQTIYSFTGASSLYLAHFTDEFKDARVIELIRDYRSTPQIVATANDVIASDVSEGAVRLVSQVPSGVPVKWKEYEDDAAEAADIASNIRELQLAGVPLGDMAILYRTNAQSAEFEAALSNVGVGYTLRGSERFFSRREVREAMVALRAAARSGVQGPLADNVRATLRQMGWRDEAPEVAGAVRERWDALNALLNLATEMEHVRSASMLDFVRELEERAQTQNTPEVDGVTLSSLHAAKGLEWRVVFLTGLSEGLLPISLAKRAADVAEERRLLYVGVTRAKEQLYLSYAKGNGSRAGRKVSRFLSPLWPREEKPVSRATSYRQRRTAEAAAFVAEHGEDVALFEELAAWRTARAREMGRPPYTVLHDTTLRAIAIAKPMTLPALGRIKGIGDTKLASWGDDILHIIAAFRTDYAN